MVPRKMKYFESKSTSGFSDDGSGTKTQIVVKEKSQEKNPDSKMKPKSIYSDSTESGSAEIEVRPNKRPTLKDIESLSEDQIDVTYENGEPDDIAKLLTRAALARRKNKVAKYAGFLTKAKLVSISQRDNLE